jgi:molecular chaperone GrpE (heat shock protein)
MTTSDRGPPEDHGFERIPAARPKASRAATLRLPADQLASFLVQITRETWRLQMAIDRSNDHGQTVSDEIQASVERLHQDLESLGLEASDPVGQIYDPGMRVEIAHLEPGGSGDLVIKRTVLPGVVLNGTMIKPASVIVGRKDTS